MVSHGLIIRSITFIIGQFQEIERSRTHTQKERIRIARGLPIHTHFPTVQTAEKTEIRIRQTFIRKIVTDITDRYAPIFRNRNIARGVKCILHYRCIMPELFIYTHCKRMTQRKIIENI